MTADRPSDGTAGASLPGDAAAAAGVAAAAAAGTAAVPPAPPAWTPGDHVGHPRRWAVLAVLVVGLLIVVIDNTVLNVALKTIQQDLDATQSELLWAVDSYLLVFASLLFTWGVLGDRYGRRRILVIGLLLFMLASLLCSFAETPAQLIAFRALMGVGGAAVMPVTLAIITVVFPPRERGRAIGLWAAAVGGAVALGPVVGGLLLEHPGWYQSLTGNDWGAVFLINVPIVLIGLVGIWRVVPESRSPDRERRLDPIGVALSIAGLGMLVYGIIHAGDTKDWLRPDVLGWIVGGLALLALFVWLEARSDHPSLDVTLFQNRDWGVALVAVTLAFFALSGVTFYLAFYLQLVRGYTPLEAGLCFLPFALGQILAAPRSARMVARFGERAVIGTGLIVVTAALIWLSFLAPGTALWLVLLNFFVFGFGMGNVIAPASTVMQNVLPPARAGAGSAVQNTVRQVGGALGVAIMGTLLATQYASRVTDELGERLGGFPPAAAEAARDSIGATYGVVEGAVSSGALPVAMAHDVLLRANDAFMGAVQVTSWLSAVTTGVAAAIVLLQLPARVALPAAAVPAGAGGDGSRPALQDEPIDG
jgi:EmrB/QacA subfamily drug resistance transporter